MLLNFVVAGVIHINTWADCTGVGEEVVPRLPECCRQSQALAVCKNSNKIHQTWPKPLSGSLFKNKRQPWHDILISLLEDVNVAIFHMKPKKHLVFAASEIFGWAKKWALVSERGISEGVRDQAS